MQAFRFPKNLKTSSPNHLAFVKEWLKLIKLGAEFSVFQVPSQGLKRIPGFKASHEAMPDHPLLSLIGDSLLELLSELGPVYGKLAQTLLSRQSQENQALLAKSHVNRVYGDWPALPYAEIEKILNQEIPDWRKELRVHPIPLGVASIGQVHAATDHTGQEWVIKVVKPAAEKRLKETSAALKQFLTWLKPLTSVSKSAQRKVKEIDSFCLALEDELDLLKESENIQKIREKIGEKKGQIIRLPKIHPSLGSARVLVCERFKGIP